MMLPVVVMYVSSSSKCCAKTKRDGNGNGNGREASEGNRVAVRREITRTKGLTSLILTVAPPRLLREKSTSDQIALVIAWSKRQGKATRSSAPAFPAL